MLVFKFALIIVLLNLVNSANVLVISGIRGSHLYITSEVAEKLVEFGYNVTLLTPYDDPRVDFTNRNFSFVTYAGESDPYGVNFFERFDQALQKLVTMPTEDMVTDLLRELEDVTRDVTRMSIAYYTGDAFANFLRDGKFELIVLEQSEMLGACLKLKHFDIPLMGIYAVAEVKGLRDFHSLPGLHNSEISALNEVSDMNTPPSFAERWRVIWRNVKLYSQMYPLLLDLFGGEMERTGRTISDYYLSLFDIILVNDHPAFSFPFLTPPNAFYLGPFHLSNRVVKPLPDVFQEFIENCPHRHVVYLSFGSYFQDISKFSKSATIFHNLAKMKFCVIVKTTYDIVEKYNLPENQFLQQKWIPQKDLLGSGKVHFFISHCGNNGRMESIFYKVPLLCVPMFGDQYHNARLVSSKQFGLCLRREEVSEQGIRSALQDMSERREEFAENMRQAVEIATNDPGAGSEVLRFYTDLLIRNRNAEFLINRIVEKQYPHEILNLDFLLLAFLILLSTAMAVIICFCKFIRHCFRKRKLRTKDE